MRKRITISGMLLAASWMGVAAAVAGPWEDGMAAYNRGDYMPAIRLFRPLAEKGNAKAQNVLGVVFRKGEGVPKNSVRAHMWFSFAAARGDANAKAELRDVARTMTALEISQAQAMARACEASDYRECEY
jgi:TPR repeat protein